jgi:hypothetical protein
VNDDGGLPMRADEVEQIGARLHVDRVVAEVVAATRTVDVATVRQLAHVRVEQFDEVEVVELLLLAAVLVAERALRNLTDEA